MPEIYTIFVLNEYSGVWERRWVHIRTTEEYITSKPFLWFWTIEHKTYKFTESLEEMRRLATAEANKFTHLFKQVEIRQENFIDYSSISREPRDEVIWRNGVWLRALSE